MFRDFEPVEDTNVDHTLTVGKQFRIFGLSLQLGTVERGKIQGGDFSQGSDQRAALTFHFVPPVVSRRIVLAAILMLASPVAAADDDGQVWFLPFEIDFDSGADNGDAIIARFLPVNSIVAARTGSWSTSR